MLSIKDLMDHHGIAGDEVLQYYLEQVGREPNPAWEELYDIVEAWCAGADQCQAFIRDVQAHHVEVMNELREEQEWARELSMCQQQQVILSCAPQPQPSQQCTIESSLDKHTKRRIVEQYALRPIARANVSTHGIDYLQGAKNNNQKRYYDNMVVSDVRTKKLRSNE
jgi:hypothetical protein